MKCNQCGTDYEGKFCPNCGAPATNADATQQANNAQPTVNYNQAPVQPMAKVKKPIYKKWWFWVIIAVVAIGVIANLGGNGDKSSTKGTEAGGSSISSTTTPDETNSSSETSNTSTTSSQTVESSKSSEASITETPPAQTVSKYEQIYNEYSKKIKDAAPTSSITELAEISNEGVSKMAEYMYSAKGTDGQYATYEQWAGKLMDVYMSEAR